MKKTKQNKNLLALSWITKEHQMETHLLAKGYMPSLIHHHQLADGPRRRASLWDAKSSAEAAGGGQGVAEPAAPRGSSSHCRDPWG